MLIWPQRRHEYANAVDKDDLVMLKLIILVIMMLCGKILKIILLNVDGDDDKNSLNRDDDNCQNNFE